MNKINEVASRIKPIPQSAYDNVKRRLDNLTKPVGSLGRLEELAQRYVAIRGVDNPRFEKKVIFTFAGDHGVADDGVSAYPKEVTPQMVLNFLRGGAGVNVLARHVGAEVVVIDIGVDYDFKSADGLVVKKIARGTKNMLKGPAMPREEAVKGIEIGIGLAEEWSKKGIDIVGTGDMGIGNTTPSSAITSVMTGEPVENVTGRGTGISDEAFRKKVDIIKEAIRINKPDNRDPIDVLSKIGGYEIAGIAGLILGAASRRIPVVVDGFISGAGALIALGIQPAVRDYIFASHLSVEKGHKAVIKKFGNNALLDLNLRLGEGTGAALGIGLVEAGFKILTQMATFESAGVSKGNEQ
jgi:nicotinate-nucleotide--dimethylbenzimidazole phosphoribosyltransferase